MDDINTYTFKIKPVAAPRMTQRDKWAKRPCVEKYYAFRNELKLLANVQGLKLGESFEIDFYIPLPKRWNRKKDGEKPNPFEPHKKKPDIDNLVKSVMDALLSEDSHVWSIHACKYWSDEGIIVIRQ